MVVGDMTLLLEIVGGCSVLFLVIYGCMGLYVVVSGTHNPSWSYLRFNGCK